MIRVPLYALAAVVGLGVSVASATTWDTNDDGSVDAKEFATGNSAAVTFDRFDDDGNGVITPNEVGLSKPDEIFERADNNSDGALSRTELSEATFASYDRDQDGMLRDDEWRRFEYDEGRRNNPFADWQAPREGSEVSQ